MIRRSVLFLITACTIWAADVSGRWNLSVESEAGSGNPTFVFKQEGDKLTGTYSGQLGDAKVTGTVNGETVEFWFEASPSGDKITVKYTGKLQGTNKIKGDIDFGGLGKGTFTGEKK